MTWAARGWIRAAALLHCQWTERETEAKGFSYLWIIIHGFGAGDSETFPGGGLTTSPAPAIRLSLQPKIVPEVANFPCPVVMVLSALFIWRLAQIAAQGRRDGRAPACNVGGGGGGLQLERLISEGSSSEGKSVYG